MEGVLQNEKAFGAQDSEQQKNAVIWMYFNLKKYREELDFFLVRNSFESFLYSFHKFYIFPSYYLSKLLPPIIWIIIPGSSFLISLLKVNAFFQLEIYSVVTFSLSLQRYIACRQLWVFLLPGQKLRFSIYYAVSWCG